jgi:hypothetical protein
LAVRESATTAVCPARGKGTLHVIWLQIDGVDGEIPLRIEALGTNSRCPNGDMSDRNGGASV